MTSRYPNLLSPLELGSVSLANRVVFASHGTKQIRDNLPTNEFSAYLEDRARGGAALLILQYTVIHSTDVNSPTVLAGYLEEIVPIYRRLMERVRPYGTRVFVQLNHRGGQRGREAPREPAVAPSAVPTSG